jgi:uncharacterized protein
MDLFDNSMLLLLPVCGFVIGLLIGLTGVGAGSLTTPMLIVGFNVHPVVAVGTDLLFAAITKSAAALGHHRLGHVDWRAVGWLAAGSLPAAAMTLAVLARVDIDTVLLAKLLRQVLAVALVISAAAIWLRGHRLLAAAVQPPGLAALTSRQCAALIGTGLVLGVLVALTSIGAGAIGVVALAISLPGLAARRIVGTDIVHAIPLTVVAGLGHLALGHTDFALLGLLLCGSVPGIGVGSALSGRVSDSALRSMLAAVLLLAAGALMLK